VETQSINESAAPCFISRAGDMFRLSQLPKDGVLLGTHAAATTKEPGDIGRLIRVSGDEWLAFSSRGDRLWKLQAATEGTSFQTTAIRLPEPVAEAVAFVKGQLIAASEKGRVYAVDWKSGKGEYRPLQLPASPRERFTWVDATATAEGEVLLADREHGVFRVSLRDAPTRHVSLEAAATTDVGPSGIVELSGIVLTVDGRYTMHAHRLPDLESEGDLELGGRCVWGPVAVGDAALLAIDDGRLLIVDQTPEIRGRIDLQNDRPTGRPWQVGTEVLLATRRGAVLRIDPGQGKILDRSDLHVPLVSGPIDIQGTIVVGTTDGHLVFLDAEPLLSLNDPRNVMPFRQNP
ncbi:MAG: hypothetical protein D6741_10900, partial [Planctomycetota bacterium]